MARIRSRGNRDTELALVRLLQSHGVTGWRRQQVIKVRDKKLRARTAEAQWRRRRRLRQSRPASVRVDFIFPKQRVAVFVDGCFWHGCPIHSPPARWLAKSTMPATTRSLASLGMTKQPEDATAPDASGTAATGKLRTGNREPRTGKAFWRAKLAANIERDRLFNRQLRRQGWRVVRIWEHELAGNPARCLRRIRQALRAGQ
jgi:DNA mismatch endonuclease (patch repair protein)